MTPTITIQPGLRAETLPRPLYFLAATRKEPWPKQLWRLDPYASEVLSMTSAEIAISAAAIWPGDGRLAFGTEEGQVYVIRPGESPRLLLDTGPSGEEELSFDRTFISGLAWSPEGKRLAYSVRSYSKDPSPEADGLWLLSLAEGTPIKLLDNHYLDPETNNVLDVRIARPLAWSPDGEALLLRMGYWEWSDVVWLEPVAPAVDDSNLHDPEGMWVEGSWSADGRSVWLLGLNQSVVSDLGQADRQQAGVTLLLDGDVEALAFYRAQEVPEGLVFLGIDVMGDGARLYLGSESDSGFTYEAIGPADPLCHGGPVWDIVWDPTGQWAAVSCQKEVKLISLDGKSEEDLTPFVQTLDWRIERSVLFWGS